MIYESFESEQLEKLIANKKAYLSTLKNDTSAKLLQREIMFLEKEILPVVLSNTVVAHYEVMRYCLRCFDEAIKRECNGLLLYLPIMDDYSKYTKPVIGIANSSKKCATIPYREIEIYCDHVEIFNMDGSGLDNIKCFTLTIEP